MTKDEALNLVIYRIKELKERIAKLDSIPGKDAKINRELRSLVGLVKDNEHMFALIDKYHC